MRSAEAAQHKHKFSCTLERYRTCGGVRVPYVSHQLQLLMQSVVLAAESRDVPSLRQLQSELWFLLTPAQNELLYDLPKLVDL
eukprot:m.675179 g.675179  ORF g.675179 m.675179 type:complete len:83 (-) comp22788_c1_seq5:2656-2904(-)